MEDDEKENYTTITVNFTPNGPLVFEENTGHNVQFEYPMRRWRWRRSRVPGRFWDPLLNPRDYDDDYETSFSDMDMYETEQGHDQSMLSAPGSLRNRSLSQSILDPSPSVQQRNSSPNRG